MIINKQLFFKVQNEIKGPFNRNFGSPQGCKLSPILYIIYTKKLQDVLDNDVFSLFFADDTIFYTPSKNIQDDIHLLEQNLKKVSHFLKDHGLPLSPGKTKFIVFEKSRSLKPEGSYTINFENQIIKNTNVIKYLGLKLDSQLNCKTQTNYVCNSATKALKIIKVLRGTWWGGHPQILLNIYKGLIRSKIEYGTFIWLPGDNFSLLQKINRIQNNAIRLLLGCRMSTPIRVLHAEAKIPYFIVRTKYLANTFSIKLISFTEHPLNFELSSLYLKIRNTKEQETVMNKFILLRSYISLLYSYSSLIQKFDLALPYPFSYNNSIITDFSNIIDITSGLALKDSKNVIEDFERITCKYPATKNFFTDGSKTDNSTGAASFATFDNKFVKIKLPR